MAEFIKMCPHCNANLRVQDEWISRNVRCPKCQTAFIFSDQGTTQKKQNNESSVPEIYACTKCKKEYDGSTKFCCECGGKVKLTQEKNTESTESDILSVFWGIAIFIGLFGLPLLLYWWIDWPRTVFWCTLPLWALGLLLVREIFGNFVFIVLAGIVWWGWNAHTQVEVPTPKQTIKITSQAPAATSAQANDTRSSSQEKKIRITVTVQKKQSGYGYWNDICEYRLYADDQLIATKHSYVMLVQFEVTVKKGTTLRAEMLVKNKYGGIGEILEGPFGGQDAKANYHAEHINIDCW